MTESDSHTLRHRFIQVNVQLQNSPEVEHKRQTQELEMLHIMVPMVKLNRTSVPIDAFIDHKRPHAMVDEPGPSLSPSSSSGSRAATA